MSIMDTQNTQENEQEKTKAYKILNLTEELAEIERQSKSIRQAFNEEKKRIKKEIACILLGEETDEQIVKNISDVHDVV